MEVEKLIKFGVDYLSDFLEAFFKTLRGPTIEFPPTAPPTRNGSVIASGQAGAGAGMRLNPKLFGFVFTSIGAGRALVISVSGGSGEPDFLTSVVMVFTCWLLFSSLVHFLCKKFAGRGTFAQTVSINLQVMAVVYVLSSFAAFLWASVVSEIARCASLPNLHSFWGKALLEEPVHLFFVVEFALALVYLPWANGRVHGFRLNQLRAAFFNQSFTPLGKTLSQILSFTVITFLYVAFFVVSAMIAGLSMAAFHRNNVPFSAPRLEIMERALTESDGLSGDESPRALISQARKPTPIVALSPNNSAATPKWRGYAQAKLRTEQEATSATTESEVSAVPPSPLTGETKALADATNKGIEDTYSQHLVAVNTSAGTVYYRREPGDTPPANNSAQGAAKEVRRTLTGCMQ